MDMTRWSRLPMTTKSITHKRSAGGIVHSEGKFLTLNVTKYGEVVFPKGTIESGETPEQAAVREILEETGYHVKIKAPLGEVSYEFDEDDGKRYRKTVYYYLFELVDENEQPKPNREVHENEEGIENLWLSFDDALERLAHDESKEKLQKAVINLQAIDHRRAPSTYLRGFTLIELLIVIVIIAILAAITVVAYNGIQSRAQNVSTTSAVTQYARGLMMYQSENGSYPGPVYDASTNTRYILCMDGTATCWTGADETRSAVTAGALRSIMGSLPDVLGGHALTYSPAEGYYILFTQRGTSECPSVSGTTPGTKTISGSNVQCRVRLPSP